MNCLLFNRDIMHFSFYWIEPSIPKWIDEKQVYHDDLDEYISEMVLVSSSGRNEIKDIWTEPTGKESCSMNELSYIPGSWL